MDNEPEINKKVCLPESKLRQPQKIDISVIDHDTPKKYFRQKTLQNLLLWLFCKNQVNPLWLTVHVLFCLQKNKHLIRCGVVLQVNSTMDLDKVPFLKQFASKDKIVSFRENESKCNLWQSLFFTKYHEDPVFQTQQKPIINSNNIEDRIYKRFAQFALNQEQQKFNLYPVDRKVYHDYHVIKNEAKFESRVNILAIDCEMVMTEVGLELARISVIDYDYNLLLDEFVMPPNKILNYNTQYSGITEEILKNVTMKLSDIHEKLETILNTETILIGHSLENDLNAMQLMHSKIVDTSVLYLTESNRKISLKQLAQKYLNLSIQKDTHDSIEDAKMTLTLARLRIELLDQFPSTSFAQPATHTPDVLLQLKRLGGVHVVEIKKDLEQLLKFDIGFEDTDQLDDIQKFHRMSDLLKQRNANAPNPKLIFAEISSIDNDGLQSMYNNAPPLSVLVEHPNHSCLQRSDVNYKYLLNFSMEDDQEKYLEDARKVVKEQAYFMKAALDKAQLKDALRYSSAMLSELRTSLLTPRNYYILFMQVFDEMRILEQYFKEEYRRGRKMIDLYESVQHATSVIPRLYLLITVGSVYIQTHETSAIKILRDLIECIKAVQHPLRGLFLRYYFLKLCKDRLPDTGSEYEGQGGNIDDAIEVIVRNLSEMNKLWIRMQGSKEKSKRERERMDLKVTIGENVTRLSNLEGVSLDTYKTKVLPQLLQIAVQSKDVISQGYLIDCTIQAFPDEYHLQTLEDLLKVCTTELEPNVDVKNIFILLMSRLADFALNNDMNNYNQEIDIYKMFKGNIDKMLDSNGQIEFKNLLDLQVAFLNFTLKCYPQNSQYVNSILQSCCKLCSRQSESDFSEECQKNIVKFLTMPLETMSLTILTMDEYPNLMKNLPFSKRRQVAVKICQAVVNLNQILDDVVITTQLLKFIQPLLVTEQDYVEIPEQDFEEEQQLVSRVIHLVKSQDLKLQNVILQLFIERFLKGELNRQRFTIPSTVFALFKLLNQAHEAQDFESVSKGDTLGQIKSLIELIQPTYPEVGMKLYLNLLLSVNQIDQQQEFDEFTYEIGTQIITIFQDELGDSNIKFIAIHQIMATIAKLTCVSADNYDNLASNATSQAAKLLKKHEQAVAVLNATHMFYNEHQKFPERVIECFKKAIKIASGTIATNPKLVYVYISILNKYFHFMNSIQFKPQDLQDVIKVILEKYPKAIQDNDDQSKRIKTYWNNTQEYITLKKKAGVEAFLIINI